MSQFIYRLGDRHVSYTLGRGVDRYGAGENDEQKHRGERGKGNVPRAAEVGDNYPDIDKIVEQQPEGYPGRLHR